MKNQIKKNSKTVQYSMFHKQLPLQLFVLSGILYILYFLISLWPGS